MINHMSDKSKLIAAAARSKKFAIQATSWGYAVRMPGNTGFWARFAQALAGGVALVSIGIAVGMWVMPGSEMGADIALFKAALSGVLVLTGLLALWFAAQGTTYELQVDSVKRELREVLRNKKGQNLVLRRMPFNDIRSVILSRDPQRNLPGYARLMLRHKTQGHCIDLVTDKDDRLEALREVLARDILMGEAEMAKASVVTPRRGAIVRHEREMPIPAQ
ncbi:hypothetical protein AB9F29_13675 [Falsihalocynthiibacter sp. S25ZX9]|uniref:hypothetical protein n=1 Tax=Falsihalocynthiibacter sp. S25ZX9 TaxID=3240870 RepID=UPI00350F3785